MSLKYKLRHQESGAASRRVRGEEIADNRNKFKYNQDFARQTGLRGIEKAPAPSFAWTAANAIWSVFTVANNADRVSQLRINSLVDAQGAEGLQSKHVHLRKVTLDQAAEDALYTMPPTEASLHALYESLRASSSNVFIPEDLPPLSVHEYDDLFTAEGIKPRESGEQLFDDETFARMAVAGAHPLLIENVNQERLQGFASEGFPVSDEVFQPASPFTQNGDNSLVRLANSGRLFYEDYSALEGLVGRKKAGDEERYVFAPKVLYGLTQVGGQETLMPIAIQCRELDTDGQVIPGPIFYPHTENAVSYESDFLVQSKDYTWQIAKTIVLGAATNYHEMISHLALTHFMMEEFAMSAIRTMSAKHPFIAFLSPHFFGTFSRNEFGRNTLLSADGLVDQAFGASVESFTDGVAKALKNYSFSASYLPTLLETRGVHPEKSANPLPYYPYAEDSLAHWRAIRRYVENFLSIYYQSDEDLLADLDVTNGGELGAFFKELTEEQTIGGIRLRGIPVTTPSNLAEFFDFVTMIIFTASAQHAAINTPQRDRLSNPAWQPAAIFKPAPTQFGATRQDYLELLPPYDVALMQVNIGLALSFRYTAIDMMQTSQFVKSRDEEFPRIERAIRIFKADLKEIERNINRRNNALPRTHWYQYLLPALVPQSINA